LKRVGDELFKQYSTTAKAYDALSGAGPGLPGIDPAAAASGAAAGLDHDTFSNRIYELLYAAGAATNADPPNGEEAVKEKSQLRELAAYIDVNRDGTIQLSEFLEAFQVLDQPAVSSSFSPQFDPILTLLGD